MRQPHRSAPRSMAIVLATGLCACAATQRAPASPAASTPGAKPTLALTLLVSEQAKARPATHAAPYLHVRSRRLDASLAVAARGAPDVAANRAKARAAAKAALQAARASYRQLDFAAVITRCQSAESALVAATASPREARLLGELLLLRGQAHLAQKKSEAAAEALAFAIDLGAVPAAKSGRFPPETESLLAKLRQRPAGTLSLTSSPAGAEVIVDGQPRGSTPLSLRVRAGAHHVRVRQVGWRARSTLHTVAEGRVATLAVSLEAASKAEQARQLRGALAHTSAATKRRVLLDATARLLGADGWIARLGPSEEASIVRGERPARGALACADDDQRCLARSLYLLARGEAPPAPPRAAAPAPFYKRWWFWTIVGAAVAGGAATGIYFGTRTPSGVDVVATTR